MKIDLLNKISGSSNQEYYWLNSFSQPNNLEFYRYYNMRDEEKNADLKKWILAKKFANI